MSQSVGGIRDTLGYANEGIVDVVYLCVVTCLIYTIVSVIFFGGAKYWKYSVDVKPIVFEALTTGMLMIAVLANKHVHKAFERYSQLLLGEKKVCGIVKGMFLLSIMIPTFLLGHQITSMVFRRHISYRQILVFTAITAVLDVAAFILFFLM